MIQFFLWLKIITGITETFGIIEIITEIIIGQLKKLVHPIIPMTIRPK